MTPHPPGDYFIWAKYYPQGGFLCTIARINLVIFLKPLVPCMWYGLGHLLDKNGQMLEHNVLTDTLVSECVCVRVGRVSCCFTRILTPPRSPRRRWSSTCARSGCGLLSRR